MALETSKYEFFEDISQYYHVHEKKLGEGGFAKVRLATHLATKQPVAIKCIDKIKIGPELPRIYNEIECLKKLKHNNIARLYQVFETRTSIYLVLEYCAGGELFDYIVSKSKLEESESAQIIHDLMRVLNFIHINGFAHRDLKPENVLFDDKHHIKLIDFGLAANCSANILATSSNQSSIDQLTTCCGSVTYAAPEVISGRVYSGTAVDVWSAGVMLYALLVGQLPFNDNNIPRLYEKIQAGIKTLPSFLSQEACDLIRKMLTVDPTQRITVREVLTHPWLRNRINLFAKIHRRLDFGDQLDEHLFAKCSEKFPHLSMAQLREYILRDYNYYSTTYHLMVAKCPPRTSGAIKRTPDRYQSIIPPNTVSPQKRTRLATLTNSPHTPKNQIIVSTKTPRTFGGVKRTPDRLRVSNQPRSVSPQKRPRWLAAAAANAPRTPRNRLITVTNSPRTPKTPLVSVTKSHRTSKTPSSYLKTPKKCCVKLFTYVKSINSPRTLL